MKSARTLLVFSALAVAQLLVSCRTADPGTAPRAGASNTSSPGISESGVNMYNDPWEMQRRQYEQTRKLSRGL